MKFVPPVNLSGYILESSSEPVTNETLTIPEQVTFVREFSKAKNWELYNFKSKQPLLGEVEQDLNASYDYPVICRRSGRRFLILSIGRNIIDHLLSNIFAPIIRPTFQNVPVAIHDLVTRITQQPQRYVLSFVHARVSGYGAAVRAVSFYGEDVGEADIFRSNLYLFNCFTCGLRNVAGGGEILRINSEGFVYFLCPSELRLREVQLILNFVRDLGFLGYDKNPPNGDD